MQVLTALVVAGALIAAAPPHRVTPPALAVVLHVDGPASTDDRIAAAEAALRAPEEIGEPLLALREHRGARIAFAVDPAFMSGLARAVSGASTLDDLAAAKTSPAIDQTDPLLAVLARHRPMDPALAKSAYGSRYLTLAISANDRLAGESNVRFSPQELAEFAQDDAAVILESADPQDLLAARIAANAAKSDTPLDGLRREDGGIERELLADVRAGTVELIATPDFDPVLPLVADSGGKTSADLNVVEAGTHADAQWLISDAIKSVGDAAGQKKCGLYSPFGAYDDETAALAQSAGAGFALFSDRVVHGVGGQGTDEGLQSGRASALHAYALTVAKGVSLATLFWNETASDAIASASGNSSTAATLLDTFSHQAAVDASNDSYPHVLIVRLGTQDPWLQRVDARQAIGDLVATIATGAAGQPITPSEFLRAHPATASAYGFPPNSELGSLAYWMGSPNQASLWNALAQARSAAGGDKVLSNAGLRDLVFSAESAHWYSVFGVPESQGRIDQRLDDFRALIARIYRTAGATPPATIAPVRRPTPPPGPVHTPAPTPTPIMPSASPRPG